MDIAAADIIVLWRSLLLSLFAIGATFVAKRLRDGAWRGKHSFAIAIGYWTAVKHLIQAILFLSVAFLAKKLLSPDIIASASNEFVRFAGYASYYVFFCASIFLSVIYFLNAFLVWLLFLKKQAKGSRDAAPPQN